MCFRYSIRARPAQERHGRLATLIRVPPDSNSATRIGLMPVGRLEPLECTAQVDFTVSIHPFAMSHGHPLWVPRKHLLHGRPRGTPPHTREPQVKWRKAGVNPGKARDRALPPSPVSPDKLAAEVLGHIRDDRSRRWWVMEFNFIEQRGATEPDLIDLIAPFERRLKGKIRPLSDCRSRGPTAWPQDKRRPSPLGTGDEAHSGSRDV